MTDTLIDLDARIRRVDLRTTQAHDWINATVPLLRRLVERVIELENRVAKTELKG